MTQFVYEPTTVEFRNPCSVQGLRDRYSVYHNPTSV